MTMPLSVTPTVAGGQVSYTFVYPSTGGGGTADGAGVMVTQTKTSSFTATAGVFYLMDTTSAVVTATLPPANVAGDMVAFKWNAGTANAATIIRAGTDTIGAGTTTATFALASETWLFESSGTGQWNLLAGNKSTASLDGRYAQISTIDAKGDLLVGTADNALARVGVGSNGQALRADSTQTPGVKWTTPVDIQVFTVSGTWTNPSPSVARPVRVWGVSAGNGGGSGRRGAAGTVRCGGGGGSAGTPFETWLLSTELPATVPVTVGAGGAGGAAVTVDSTDGNPGVSGGTTQFGSTATQYRSGATNAGTGGGRGGTATSGTGGTNSSGVPAGGAASGTGGTGSQGGSLSIATGWSLWAPSGGGAGGGISSADATANGGSGGGLTGIANGSANPSGVGGVGPDATATGITGVGGWGAAGGNSGSGTAGSTTAGGNGGTGGAYGGGGGGGGASTNGNNSGAGGPGFDGYCRVTTYL